MALFISKYPIQQPEHSGQDWKCDYTTAENYCKQLSQIESTQVLLPNSMLWEMAVRGHNGRIYPWGLSYSNDMLDLESPWGLRRTVGFGGEWTSSKTKDQLQIIMGASKQLRCSEINFAEKNNSFGFRIVVSS